jgi:hypothetical protein
MAIEGWDCAGNPFYPKGTNRVGLAQEAGSKELSGDFEPFVACRGDIYARLRVSPNPPRGGTLR